MNNSSNKWQNHDLGSLLEIVIDHRGLTPKKLGSEWRENGVPTISAMNIKGGKLVNHDKIRFVDDELYSKWMREGLNEGDVILTSEAPLGEAYIVKNGEKFCLSQRLFALRPEKNRLHSGYLYYFLTSELGKNELSDRSTGTTASGIRQSELTKINISYPSLPIQQKISQILSSIDKLIWKTEQIIQKSETLKKGVLTKLFSDSHTNRIKLNKITKKITDGTHRTPKYVEYGVPFLRINDIRSHKIDWSRCKYISNEEHLKLIKRCKPENGDVLLSKNGTIGITKVVDWNQEFSIFVSLCLIKPDKTLVFSEYVGLVLGSDYLLDQVQKRSKQGTVTNLHLEEIRDFDIPLPSKERQKEILDITISLDEKINHELKTLDQLRKLKLGLVQDIFNQKIEIN